MRIIFATNDAKQKNEALNKLGVVHRLLSYYYIRDSAPDFLKQYSETGEYRGKPIERKQLKV